ncbi:MAG: urease accessory protein UreD [Acidiphilium sp.]
MLDSAQIAVPVQRAVGAVRLAMKRRGDATVVDRLHQSGPLRARIVHAEPGQGAGCVLLNTAGGIAGGDDLSIEIAAAPTTAITVATQGAERVYRARAEDAPARLATRVVLGAAASLEYLPQETILFAGAALNRTLRIEMAADAAFLGVEALVFGRTAMGERLRHCRIVETIALYREDALVFRDRFAPPPDFAAAVRPAMLGDAGAMATIVHAAEDSASRLDAVRAMLDGDAGASAWNGMLLVRILAADGAMLRAMVRRVLDVLREGRKMPRVWEC